MGIIFIGYALQSRFRPFLDQLDLDIAADSVAHVKVDGAVLNYVRALAEIDVERHAGSVFFCLFR